MRTNPLLAMLPGVGWAEALFLISVYAIWIPLGGYVAKQKRRNVTEGVLLGFLGPFGVLIEALLPNNSAPGASREL